MNYKEFMDYAKANYCNGGDAIVECWDESTFNEYVAECGPMTKKRADDLMGTYQQVLADEEGAGDYYISEDLGMRWY